MSERSGAGALRRGRIGGQGAPRLSGGPWPSWLIGPVVATILALGTIAIASADTPAQVGIRPATPGPSRETSGYFVLKAQPGDNLHDSVVVANPGTIPVKALVYPVDAATGQSGGAVYLNRGEPRRDVGAWITLGAGEVDVPPGHQVTIDFTVAVPANTRAGVHLGGIVAEIELPQTPTPVAGPTGAAPAGFGITTITRAVTAVQVTVGDDGAPSLKISGAQVDVAGVGPTLVLTVNNDGTTLLKPHGTLTLTDQNQSVAFSRVLTIDTLVPGTTTTLPIVPDSPVPAGSYQLHVSLDYGGSNPATYDAAITMPRVDVVPTPVVQGATPRASVATSGVTATTPPGPSPVLLVVGSVAGTLVVTGMGFFAYVKRARK